MFQVSFTLHSRLNQFLSSAQPLRDGNSFTTRALHTGKTKRTFATGDRKAVFANGNQCAGRGVNTIIGCMGLPDLEFFILNGGFVPGKGIKCANSTLD